MTEPRKQEEVPKVDQKVQVENLVANGVRPSGNTASGYAVSEGGQMKIGGEEAEHFGEAGDGAEEVGTDTLTEPGKSHGAQLEPAIMTAGGSIPHATLPSPSGPVPAGVIADERVRRAALATVVRNHTDARGRVRNSRFRLSENEIRRMSPAVLRAVGSDRGYDVPDTGRQRIVNAFLKAQADDDSLEDPEKGVEATRMLDQQPVPVPGTTAAATTSIRPTAVGSTTPAASPAKTTSSPAPAALPPKGGPAT